MADSQNSICTLPTAGVPIDPVILAIAAERAAGEAYEAALNALDQVGVFGPEPITHAVISWELYRQEDLLKEEASASKALTQAERDVLRAKPQSIQGAAALLGFLQRHLSEDQAMPLSVRRAVAAIANIESLLLIALHLKCGCSTQPTVN